MKKKSIEWARGERGYCGTCGHQFALHMSGVLRIHSRLFVGGQRYRCAGSRTDGVSKEAAIRAMLGQSQSDVAVGEASE